MHSFNKFLKVVFIFSSFALLLVLVGSPKTHCQACSLEYGGKTYDGNEAFEFYEEACISYAKPWDTTPIYIDLDELNISEDDRGMQVITFNKSLLNQ